MLEGEAYGLGEAVLYAFKLLNKVFPLTQGSCVIYGFSVAQTSTYTIQYVPEYVVLICGHKSIKGDITCFL